MITYQDGADHRRLRGLVNRTFTPRTVDAMRPFVRATAERLAEGLASVEVSDFVEGFADPLPITVLCELLGVPARDYDLFRGWTTDIGLAFGIASGGDVPARAEAAAAGLSSYVESLIAAKEQRPGDDLISALIEASRDGARISRRS